MRKAPKYGNRRTNGFASKREAQRHTELVLLQRAGHIRDLENQWRFHIIINGMKVCEYIADFIYTDVSTSRQVVEDAKGYATTVYRLKKKLMKAVMGIEIKEV